MKYLLTLTLFILSLLPSQAAKRIEAHPINIAVSLVEKSDSTKLASTLDYYGYSFDGKEDGYVVMKDSKGNEIRYTFESSNKYPTVIVRTHDTHKNIDTRFKELNFDKVGSNYERVRNMYSKYKTHCSFGPKSTLIIQRIQN